MSRQLWQRATENLPALWLNDELTQKTQAQLVEFSHTDPQVLANTHDSHRFKNITALQNWLSKGKTLFVLETEPGDLLGFAWVSQKALPTISQPLFEIAHPENYQLTFGIRLYGAARGQGLAIPFLRLVLAKFKNQSSQFWLKTKAGNLPAVETYKTIGFQQVAKPDSDGEILMVVPAMR